MRLGNLKKMEPDLFDGKDTRAVMRNLEGLAKYAQDSVPGFHGPFCGKKAKKKPTGGAGGASALPGCYSAIQAGQAGRPVVLGGGPRGYTPFVGGRGM